MNDFGPSSIDGWLTGLIASELQIDNASILDTVHRQLMLDGRRVDLDARPERGEQPFLLHRVGRTGGPASIRMCVITYWDNQAPGNFSTPTIVCWTW